MPSDDAKGMTCDYNNALSESTRTGAVSPRILIVKIAALGDAIMASSLIPAIRHEWPAATIGWVAGRGVAPVVGLFEGLNEIITIDDHALLRGGRLKAVSAMAAAWKKIGRRWDVTIVAHTDRRYSLISAASGAHAVVRFAEDFAPRSGRWHGAEYARMAAALQGPRASHDTPAGVLPTSCYATVRRGLLPAPPSVAGQGPLVVLVPGGARNILRDDHLRRWPIESWAHTATELLRLGYRVVAAGAPEDLEECRRVESAGAHNLCGRTNLLEFTSLLDSADVVVTHDSGALHLALLLERPVVALFGPTVPSERIPAHSNAVVLSRANELPCAPCYDGRNYAECALNLCLTRVPALEVVNAVSALVEKQIAVGQRGMQA